MISSVVDDMTVQPRSTTGGTDSYPTTAVPTRIASNELISRCRSSKPILR
jgi:hypothetical protein